MPCTLVRTSCGAGDSLRRCGQVTHGVRQGIHIRIHFYCWPNPWRCLPIQHRRRDCVASDISTALPVRRVTARAELPLPPGIPDLSRWDLSRAGFLRPSSSAPSSIAVGLQGWSSRSSVRRKLGSARPPDGGRACCRPTTYGGRNLLSTRVSADPSIVNEVSTRVDVVADDAAHRFVSPRTPCL